MATKKYLKGWKVVRVVRTYEKDRVRSKKHFFSSHHGNLEYKFDEPTMPAEGCGALCVFKDRHSAIGFIQCFGGIEHMALPCMYRPDDHRTIWTRSDKGTITNRKKIYTLPAGKALAKEVILKRLERGEPYV